MNKCWCEFTESVKGKKIVCYGAGVNASLMLLKKCFQPYLDKISFLIDKDEKKNGTKLFSKDSCFDIRSIDALDSIGPDTVILVTIADYITTGKMLDSKGLKWFPWTVISTDLSFSQLEDQIRSDAPQYFLLNTPDYMNLGDHAITIAENNYLHDVVGDFFQFGSNVCHFEGLMQLSKYVKPSDIIFVQGGGNMGSLWRVCEENIRNIVRIFPNNKIVIFPQSVYYGDSDEEYLYFTESQKVYNAHKDLLICSRDRRSFDFVSNSYECGSMLLPDMVLTLEHNKSSSRRGIGLLLRNDKEKFINDDYYLTIEAAVKALGKDIIPITHHIIDDPSNRQYRINELFDIYSSCELVITDRLHGMIISAVTNTPCIAFDNSYHKVSDLYKTWLTGCSHIAFSQQLSEDDLSALISDKLGKDYPPFDPRVFRKEFDTLSAYLKN